MLNLRQPTALTPLVVTQAFEKIGSQLLQVLIVIFLTQSIGLDDKATFELVSTFSALLLISYLFGGILSDQLIGYRRSIVWGCCLLTAGYVLLSTQNLHLLHIALALLAVGSALFTPNLTGFLGEFFYERDPRRNAAFIWLYFSMNIGAFIAAILATVGQTFYGWQITFYFSAFSTIIAMLAFIYGSRNYENRGQLPNRGLTATAKTKHPLAALIIIVLVALVYTLLNHILLRNLAIILVTIIVMAILLIASLYRGNEERHRLIRLILLIIFSTIFWSICFQEYLTVPLFINRTVGLHFYNYRIPPPVYFAFNALLVAIFCPILASIWQKLHQKQREPAPGTKIALSLLSLGVGMTALAIGSMNPNHAFEIHASWILAAFVFIALGESMLYPTGLSLTTLLAPKRWRGPLIALWFMAVGMGYFIAGNLAQQASIPKSIDDLKIADSLYAAAFAHYAIIAYVAGVVLLLLMPVLKRMVPIHLVGSQKK